MEKAPTGTWFVDEEIQQAQYINKVHQAAIPGHVKDYLKTIAGVATWRKKGKPSESYVPCYATQDTIQIYMSRCRDYVTKAKKKAEELGWIYVEKNKGQSDWIWPLVGREDPDFKQKEKRVKPDDWTPKIPPVIHPGMQGLSNSYN
jgi:hypothetical protein